MQGAPLSAVNAVLAHADRDGPHANLSRLMKTAARVGLNGRDLRAAVTSSFPTDLQSADDRWTAAAAIRTAHAAAFPAAAAARSTTQPTLTHRTGQAAQPQRPARTGEVAR